MSRGARTRGIDLLALFSFLALITIGWFSLFSTVYDGTGFSNVLNLSSTIGRQSLWLAVSLVVFVSCLTIEWKFWSTFSYFIFSASIVLLILVLIFGLEIKGAKSWFSVFGFSFQPAEFSKLGACLAMSSYLSSPQIDVRNLKHLMFAVGIMMVSPLLILLQPDAGTAIVFSSFLLVIYRAGANRLYYILAFILFGNIIGSLLFSTEFISIFILLLCIGIHLVVYRKEKQYLLAYGLAALGSFVFYRFNYGQFVIAFLGMAYIIMLTRSVLIKQFRIATVSLFLLIFSFIITLAIQWSFDHLLKPHQQDRINVWLRPDLCDPRGSLYNIIQSKIAIGSGGITGTGFLNGAMTKLDFVPEQTTDFIFCTVGEEQGFLGVLGVIILFTILFYRMIIMAERQSINFKKYYIYSVLGILFFHMFVNIGMTMGLMPVVGIPLPFMSKGGSSLLTFCMLFGILFKLDITRQR